MYNNKLLTHINFAKGFRGGERQTQLLIEELSNRGYHQQIVTRKNSELANRLNGLKNLKIIKISKPYILHISKVKNSSLIHAHETKGAQFAYCANLTYKIPYMVTRRVDNPIKNNFFNRAIYQNTMFTVALSNAIKRETLKVSPNANIKIIPSAYSKLVVNDAEVKNISLRFKDKFLIGNIGELDNNHKGQYYLIEAMKKLALKYPEIHLILLGRGKDEQNYKEQAKDLKNITFEGFVDNVGDYISCFDMFVFPSLNEGLGSILFDIMQANVPIIASNVGGIPDIITHEKNGILVEPKNSEAIFDTIEKLYLDKNTRDKLATEAFMSVDNYSYQKMCDRYEDIYLKTINKS
jgi:glycosyltransferase involved in cell wall biosynthesis